MVYKDLVRLLKLVVIKESFSPWSSCVRLVRRPCGNRPCLDNRKVNLVTIKEAYLVSNIKYILSKLPRAEYITGFDLNYALQQNPLNVESKEKTGPTVPGPALYQLLIMRFGLCNASPTMPRLMDKVIQNELQTEVFVYLDDLLIVSNNFEHYKYVLKLVAKRFR